MFKTIILVMIAGTLIGGAYYALNRDNMSEEIIKDENLLVDSSNVNPPEISDEKKMAFGEFLKKGGSYKCEVSQYLGDGYSNATKGITYIKDGMIRGEYISKVQNMNIDSTILVRDGYTYSWTSMIPGTGFKVKILTNSEGNPGTETNEAYSWDTSKIGDYNCEPWIVDESKFFIPADIVFQEINK